MTTAAAAFLCGSVVYLGRGAGLWEESTLGVALTLVGATGFYVQRRTRELVVASRKDDLMGKYILGERIGAGGMAEVFKATCSPGNPASGPPRPRWWGAA